MVADPVSGTIGANHGRRASRPARPVSLPERTGRAAAITVTIVLALVIACYASILPVGKWQPDEYIQFYMQDVHGWRAVADRVFGWSPRPVSELVLWAYGTAVRLAGRPLTTPFLAATWLVLLLGFLIAAGRSQRRPALITVVLVAAFLLLGKPGEMFYWPAATAAYLLGVCAIGMACLLATDPRPRSWIVASVLVTAAWCLEVGAIAVLIDSGLLLGARFATGNRVRIRWGVWASAVAAALFVVAVTALHRGGSSQDVLDPGSPTAGRVVASLEAATPVYLRELLSVPLGNPAWNVPAGIALKLLLLVGFRPGWRQDLPDVWAATAIRGTALLLAAFASLVLAYRQFGVDCCERQQTFRTALTVLALYAFAQAWPTRRAPIWQPVLLGLPLLLIFVVRAPDIEHDRGLLSTTEADRAAVWLSGRSPGPAMTWVNAPVPRIANGNWKLDQGTYRRTSKASPGKLDWREWGILAFFDKEILTVVDGPGARSSSGGRAVSGHAART